MEDMSFVTANIKNNLRIYTMESLAIYIYGIVLYK